MGVDSLTGVLTEINQTNSMSSLYIAASNLADTIKQLQEHNLELRFINLREIEHALDVHGPILSLPEMTDEHHND